MTARIPFTLIALLLCTAAYGQAASSGPTIATPASLITQVDTWVKVVGAIVAGLATLLGLPVVFLTYRKTRAEIAKLDLEAAALREKVPSQTDTERKGPDEGGIRINVEHSPNVNVQVLADPRFLAPLLLLLDFIFAWVILTLAGYFLSVIGLGIFDTVALAILAAILLLPIARQVLRVRAVLRPPQSAEEISASIKQAKLAVYTIYTILLVAALAIGGLVLTLESRNITDLGRYMAWGLVALGVTMAACVPILKRRVNRYFVGLLEP
jgi:hypothetical protein